MIESRGYLSHNLVLSQVNEAGEWARDNHEALNLRKVTKLGLVEFVLSVYS